LTEVIVVTSGKGGVGKTTSSASIAVGLARRGKRVAVIDFDVGLRNLDLIMGCERRVVYDFVNVIHGECTLKQALIKDKRFDTLYLLAASQTRDKDALTKEGVERVLDEMKNEGFDYVICDSPAGIEKARSWPCISPTAPSSWSIPRCRRCVIRTASSDCSPARRGAQNSAPRRSSSTCC
jgi:septum site-determining protein MinD